MNWSKTSGSSEQMSLYREFADSVFILLLGPLAMLSPSAGIFS